ncbi:putative disease resistance protein RGA3 [Tasmannia lanceolata]|uniref:putative disease resistance protein RGA3 n=1 Tax=Tasmannia lanceolata TaxID=3420 RepID=UPI004062A02B
MVKQEIQDLVKQEIKSAWGRKEELEKLESTLKQIQNVLEDAEEKQTHSTVVQEWLRKLKYEAYRADDLLDDVATESGKSELCKVQKRKRRKREFRCDSKEKKDLHLKEGDGLMRTHMKEQRQTSSLIRESDVIGRQEDKVKIIQLLKSDEFSVIPIVGMGGIGKTTLAQFIYNDESVKTHFKTRAWACAYDFSSVLTLTNALIQSATRSHCIFSSLDAAQR